MIESRRNLKYYPIIETTANNRLAVKAFLYTKNQRLGTVNTIKEAEDLYDEWFLETYSEAQFKLPKGIYYREVYKRNKELKYKGFMLIIREVNKQLFTKTSQSIIEITNIRKAIIKSLIADLN